MYHRRRRPLLSATYPHKLIMLYCPLYNMTYRYSTCNWQWNHGSTVFRFSRQLGLKISLFLIRSALIPFLSLLFYVFALDSGHHFCFLFSFSLLLFFTLGIRALVSAVEFCMCDPFLYTGTLLLLCGYCLLASWAVDCIRPTNINGFRCELFLRPVKVQLMLFSTVFIKTL